MRDVNVRFASGTDFSVYPLSSWPTFYCNVIDRMMVVTRGRCGSKTRRYRFEIGCGYFRTLLLLSGWTSGTSFQERAVLIW